MTFGSASETASAPTESRIEVTVRDIAPVLPGVVRLPDAARASAEVEGADIAGVAGHSDDASAAEGSNAAPASDVVEGQVHGLLGFLLGGWSVGAIVAWNENSNSCEQMLIDILHDLVHMSVMHELVSCTY